MDHDGLTCAGCLISWWVGYVDRVVIFLKWLFAIAPADEEIRLHQRL